MGYFPAVPPPPKTATQPIQTGAPPTPAYLPPRTPANRRDRLPPENPPSLFVGGLATTTRATRGSANDEVMMMVMMRTALAHSLPLVTVAQVPCSLDGGSPQAARASCLRGVSAVPARPSACRQRRHLLTACASGENFRHCTGHCRWNAQAALAICWLSASGWREPEASSRRQRWQSWMPRLFLPPRAQRAKATQLRSRAHRP